MSSLFALRFYFAYVLIDILRTRPTTPASLNLAIAYLQQQGSFVFTFKVLKHLEQVVRDEIKRLGGNPKLEQFMERIQPPNFHSDDSEMNAQQDWSLSFIVVGCCEEEEDRKTGDSKKHFFLLKSSSMICYYNDHSKHKKVKLEGLISILWVQNA